MALKNKIYGKMRDEIVFGKLTPGERLTETHFSKKLGCSRAPVREALNRLETEGFVTLVPNQGAVVNKISPKEIEDFYSLLEVLEAKAVEWAVPILSESDIKSLTDLNDAMKKLAHDEKDFIEKWISLNLEFHQFFRDRCGNEKMNWVVGEIRLRITRYLYSSLVISAFDEYIHDHEDIITAAKKKDSQQAGIAMANHISRAKQVLMDFFSHMPSL